MADPPEVLVGAGDIADCGAIANAQATANLLGQIPGTVFADGDLAYPNSSPTDFANCYQPTWGLYKSRTRPAMGNHEYNTTNASGYFSYWGAAAGDPAKGYYGYDLGAWHIVVLNSNCSIVNCDAGSPQEQWLRGDLAAHPTQCTAAFMHHPLFTSDPDVTPNASLQALWQALYDAGAEIMVNGHAHAYERFAPQDPAGNADSAKGLREFIVGTGGETLDSLGSPVPNSQVQNDTTHGVLKLTLHATSYDWAFIPVAGQTFTDSGSDNCH